MGNKRVLFIVDIFLLEDQAERLSRSPNTSRIFLAKSIGIEFSQRSEVLRRYALYLVAPQAWHQPIEPPAYRIKLTLGKQTCQKPILRAIIAFVQ